MLPIEYSVPLFIVGIACLIAAIIGEGIEIVGIKTSIIRSLLIRITLGISGMLIIITPFSQILFNTFNIRFPEIVDDSLPRLSMEVYPGNEIVEITNLDEGVINLDGWKLRSEVGQQEYFFENVTLKPGQTLYVISGSDTTLSIPNSILWQSSSVWNNYNDSAILFDNENNIIVQWTE